MLQHTGHFRSVPVGRFLRLLDRVVSGTLQNLLGNKCVGVNLIRGHISCQRGNIVSLQEDLVLRFQSIEIEFPRLFQCFKRKYFLIITDYVRRIHLPSAGNNIRHYFIILFGKVKALFCRPESFGALYLSARFPVDVLQAGSNQVFHLNRRQEHGVPSKVAHMGARISKH